MKRALTLCLVSVVATVSALAACEVGLRLASFRFNSFPTVQFGWPEPKVIAREFKPDYDLFWVWPDYQQVLDRARREHPEIIFLGDSCTQFGSYPRMTLDRLAAVGARYSTGLKLGVAGWTTVQGLAHVRRDVLSLRPRVVTIYFGWNDHWVALGAPDAGARPGPVWWWLSQHVRLVQLVQKARLGAVPQLEGRPNRVDVALYTSNLETMARLLLGNGAIPIFITAPSGHVRGHEPTMLALRHLRRLDDLVPLHQQYVEATREAARASGAFLCDAAAAFTRLPSPSTRYFRTDGIHLIEPGDAAMADILAGCITRAVDESVR